MKSVRGNNQPSGQSGAVSLFLVVFATLIITVITVSFIRLMLQDQTQATNADLSQSAYDSAQAGVEDGKRTLLQYRSLCLNTSSPTCTTLREALVSNECNRALTTAGVVGLVNNEVPVRQSSSSADAALDQAYTCVKIALQTPDYLGSVNANESKIIPLVGSAQFNSVRVEWFSREDLSTTTSNPAVSLTNAGDGKPLRAQDQWPATRPPVLRTQLMQYGTSATPSSFDQVSGENSNANTVFLYPVGGATPGSYSFVGNDSRAGAANETQTPLAVSCERSLASEEFACSTQLDVPDPIGGGSRNAYLRLTPYYNATHFKISLLNSGTPVAFDGVQPEIDSTGRANSLFRRIASRVDMLDTSFPYPEAALDLTGNLCKDFAITDTTYYGSTRCEP